MDYTVIFLLGVIVGLIVDAILWKRLVHYKAQTGQHLAANGQLYEIKQTNSQADVDYSHLK